MLHRLSLTLKMLAATLIAVIATGTALDYYHNKELSALYEQELLDVLTKQALIERLRFDRQVKVFHQIAQVAANYPPLIHYLKHSDGEEVTTSRRRPKWFPGRSLIGSDGHPRVAMLFDAQWKLMGGHYIQLDDLPEALLSPPLYHRTNTLGQSMLTMVAGAPWMLASAEVEFNGALVGYIMLGVPLDSELLSSIHRYDVNPNITALIDINGKHSRILASSNATHASAGMLLDDIEKDYLVTGRDFFDYGASDVAVHFVSLRSREEIDEKLGVVLDVVRQQRYVLAAALMLMLMLTIVWLGRRMRRLSQEVRDFSIKHLQADIGVSSADSLIQLERHVQYMEQKVIEVRQREQLQAEEKLQNSQVRLQDFFDYAQELIQSVRPDGKLLYVNRRWLQEMGYSEIEIQSLSLQDIIAPDCLDHFMEVFAELQLGRGFGWVETSFVTKNGCRIEVEGTARCHLENDVSIEIHGIFRNVTERKLKQEEEKRHAVQLEHTQRLESLGVLAGGIAHDFNNLLTAIMGNAAIAMSKLRKDPQAVHQRLERVVQSSEKAADLCKQMLAYSGKGSFIIEPVNVSIMLEEMTQLLEVSIHKHSELVLDLQDDIASVDADRSQLQQVIMNLITNANEANGDESGRIIVRSGVTQVDTEYLESCVEDSADQPGQYVFVEVSDSGCGMDEVTQRRIFEPFFTTKFTGRGLGMSAMQGIIRGHRGAIHIDSKRGEGTTFKVLLPVSEEGMLITKTTKDVLALPHIAGTVLVVDDEEDVRELAVSLLEEMGCSVFEAADGEQGLKLFQLHQDEINLVILDLTMPKMGGETCCHEIKLINADIPVVIVSGYSSEDVSSRFCQGEVAAFIQKPYMPDEFMESVSGLLS